MTHYHVTSRSKVDSILTRGLLTDAEGWDTGYVWLFDDIDIAFDQTRVRWGGYRDIVVLAVDTEGLDVIPDPHPGWGNHLDDHAFAVAHSIPPERITLLEAAAA